MKLGVNVDHVATLREVRGAEIPDPIQAARICEQAGADSIVCHLREDRRHINDSDLRALRKTVRTKLNLEMACAREIVEIALRVRPEQATLVPERRREITTEGGLDVIKGYRKISRAVNRLAGGGIAVSLFIDPEQGQIRTAGKIGVRCIELHTGRYAEARTRQGLNKELRQLAESAQLAKGIGLRVFAGHGLNYDNVARVAGIAELEELNIGHAIVARAVFVGLEQAVRQMRRLIGR